MNSVPGWRDPRTGRVSGFGSAEQRQNFMIGRARYCNGPSREMPRCAALTRLGQPCRAARMQNEQTCFRHNAAAKRARLVAARLSLETWTASNARKCEQNATGSAFFGAAIRASRAGRSCWSPQTKHLAKHGQQGKASSSISSTVTYQPSPTRLGGFGRECRAA
jgi:hypothetical protein